MGTIVKLDSVQDYNELLGVETLHPLVSVVDFSELESGAPLSQNFGFYAFSSSTSTADRCSTGATGTTTGKERWSSSLRDRSLASTTAKSCTDTRDGV